LSLNLLEKGFLTNKYAANVWGTCSEFTLAFIG